MESKADSSRRKIGIAFFARGCRRFYPLRNQPVERGLIRHLDSSRRKFGVTLFLRAATLEFIPCGINRLEN